MLFTPSIKNLPQRHTMSQAFKVPHVSFFTQSLEVIRGALDCVDTLLVHLTILVGGGSLIQAHEEVHVCNNLALTLVFELRLAFAGTIRLPHELLHAAMPLRHFAVISREKSLPDPRVSEEVDNRFWRPGLRRRLGGARQVGNPLGLKLVPPVPPQGSWRLSCRSHLQRIVITHRQAFIVSLPH